MEQSKYRTIILLLVITGTVAIILSIGGNHWIESSDNHRGLWRSCKKGKDCEDMSKDDLPCRRFLHLYFLLRFLIGDLLN